MNTNFFIRKTRPPGGRGTEYTGTDPSIKFRELRKNNPIVRRFWFVVFPGMCTISREMDDDFPLFSVNSSHLGGVFGFSVTYQDFCLICVKSNWKSITQVQHPRSLLVHHALTAYCLLFILFINQHNAHPDFIANGSDEFCTPRLYPLPCFLAMLFMVLGQNCLFTYVTNSSKPRNISTSRTS